MANIKKNKGAKSPALPVKILYATGIFLGIFLLLIIALALISGGIITLPAAAIRLFTFSELFVSGIPPLTMLFGGGFMFFSGVAVILFTASRICPAAAQYVFRIFSGSKSR